MMCTLDFSCRSRSFAFGATTERDRGLGIGIAQLNTPMKGTYYVYEPITVCEKEGSVR